MPLPVQSFDITRYNSGSMDKTPDLTAVEEPLEIRLGFGPEHRRREERLAVTMRTPGNDKNLVKGFLFTEGIINCSSDITSIKYCQQVKPEEAGNVIKVELAADSPVDPALWQRNFYTSSSCGVCGKASIDAVHTRTCFVVNPQGPEVKAGVIPGLPDSMQGEQTLFKHTGGIHAAGLFNNEGELLGMSEDVGRHNALDKLIGSFADQLPLTSSIVQVSGRASFELVQKAWMAGIPIISAVGAPSSLAVKLAEEARMTLIGFVRKQRFNVYTASHRVTNWVVDPVSNV